MILKIFFVLIWLLLFRCAGTSLYPSYFKGKSGKANVVHSNLTIKDGFKICAIGDTGTGGEEQKLVAEKLFDEKCQLILHLGDIVYPIGIKSVDDKDVENKFFKYYRRHLKDGAQMLLTMGNHDRYLSGIVKPWQEIAKKTEGLVYPHLFYHYRLDNICIFSLDSNDFWDEQTDWMNKEVDFNGCDLKVGMTHHPYKSSGSHGEPPGRIKRFLKETVIGKMDVLVSGHDHNLADEGEIEGTTQLVSGSGAKKRSVRIKDSKFIASTLGYAVIYRQNNHWFYKFKDIHNKSLYEKLLK